MKTQILQFTSSGKSDVLGGKISADLYLDCRVIKNPFREPSLGGKTGDDPEVQDWLVKNASQTIDAYEFLVRAGLGSWKTRNSGKSSDVFKVHCFCLAGVHRSRGVKNVLVGRFKYLLKVAHYDPGFPLEVEVL